MGKSRSNDLSSITLLFLYLCLCSLVIHVFVDHTSHANSLNRFRQVTEHGGVLDLSDFHEDEDDLIPFALASANTAKTLGLETIAANFLAFSRSIYPLLPPPKVALLHSVFFACLI